MLKVVARQNILEGKMDAYIEATKDLIDATRKEPGCVEYYVYVNRKNNIAVFLETWENKDALKVHGETLKQSPYMPKVMQFVNGELPKFPIEVYEYGY